MDKETEEKITQLQIFEQNMQAYLIQKQNFQAQLIEVENALKELEKNKKEVYKITGNIMVLADKTELKKELEEKKETTALRIRKLEKQEKELQEKAAKIQKEVMQNLQQQKK